MLKNSDFLVSSEDNEYSKKGLEMLEDVYKNHPEIAIIDSFPSYKEILTRGQIINQLKKAISSLPKDFPITIKCPESVNVKENENIKEVIFKSSIFIVFIIFIFICFYYYIIINNRYKIPLSS